MIKYNNELNLKVETGYSGKGISKYLVQFPGEKDVIYANRKEYSNYDNKIKDFVNSQSTPIFAMGIERVTSNDLLKAFWKNVDRQGTNINDYMNDVLQNFSINGNAFIIMDNVTEFKYKTAAEQAKHGEHPFCNLRSMSELYQYTMNEDKSFKILEFYNGLNENGQQTYIGYDDTHVYTYTKGKDGKYSDKVEREHGLDELPVIALAGVIDSFPPIKDIVDSNIAVYNKNSELRKYERSTTQVILEMPTTDDIDTIGMESFNIFRTNPEDRKLEFLSPDSSALTGLQNSVVLAQNSLRELATNSGSATAVDQKSSSGVELGYKFLGQSYVLKYNSNFAEAIEAVMIEMFEKFTGSTVAYTLEYPKEFVDSFATKTQEISLLSEMAKVFETLTKAGMDISTKAQTQYQELLISTLNNTKL